MKDKEFLIWLHERMEHVHNESPLMDYMHKLRAIIKATPEGRVTANCEMINSIDYFKENYLCQPSEILPCPKCREPLIEKPESPNIKRHFICPKCRWEST